MNDPMKKDASKGISETVFFLAGLRKVAIG